MFGLNEIKELALTVKADPTLDAYVGEQRSHRTFWSLVRPRVTPLEEAYRLAREGKVLFDLAHVLRETGLREDGTPKLAIAPVRAAYVEFRAYRDGQSVFVFYFLDKTRNMRYGGSYEEFDRLEMAGVFSYDDKLDTIKTNVPTVPDYVTIRQPKRTSYWVLWEPDQWQRGAVNPDPILCRRLGGLLFEVVDAWDLTPLEAALFYRY